MSDLKKTIVAFVVSVTLGLFATTCFSDDNEPSASYKQLLWKIVRLAERMVEQHDKEISLASETNQKLDELIVKMEQKKEKR